jgi:hypothetical protein
VQGSLGHAADDRGRQPPGARRGDRPHGPAPGRGGGDRRGEETRSSMERLYPTRRARYRGAYRCRISFSAARRTGLAR